MIRLLCYVCCVLTAAALEASNCTGIAAVSPKCKSNESPYIHDFYYIGGEYVYNSTLNQSIYSDQMYVEKLTPPLGVNRTYPVVFITAAVPSGAAWLNTPDNRKGWASHFIEHGYQVYIVDITANGRSGQNWIAKYPLKFASTDIITENDYTAPELINPYPQSQNHTQWPGNGTRGDPFFDAFMASTIPLTANATSQELSMRYAGCALLHFIGPSYLISHSAGATYPILISDECPDLVQASINLEPGNTPFQNLVGNATVPAVGRTAARPYGLTSTQITYNPPVSSSSDLVTETVGTDTPALRSCIMQKNDTIHTLPKVAMVPYVAITGSASPHITYDQCIINYLRQAGVDAEWIKLEDVGILGNGHFLYLEKNNLEIADVVLHWIDSKQGQD